VAMPDGSTVRFLKVGEDYDPTDRISVVAKVRGMQRQGIVPTGLLFIEESGADMHALNHTVETPLVDLPYEALCPGSDALGTLMEEYR
jgi:2-oxoglutarate/2-oxoacid ferredoxin oxidoreductase subunit beta